MDTNKLRLMLKSISADIHCGLHSGFKPCCVAYFSLISTPAFYYCKPIYRGVRYFMYIVEHLNGKDKGNLYGHIPCPLCLIRDNPTPKSEIKKCGNEPHNPWSDEDFARAREYMGIPAGGIYWADGKMHAINKDGQLEPYTDKLQIGQDKIDNAFKRFLKPLKNILVSS